MKRTSKKSIILIICVVLVILMILLFVQPFKLAPDSDELKEILAGNDCYWEKIEYNNGRCYFDFSYDGTVTIYQDNYETMTWYYEVFPERIKNSYIKIYQTMELKASDDVYQVLYFEKETLLQSDSIKDNFVTAFKKVLEKPFDLT